MQREASTRGVTLEALVIEWVLCIDPAHDDLLFCDLAFTNTQLAILRDRSDELERTRSQLLRRVIYDNTIGC